MSRPRNGLRGLTLVELLTATLLAAFVVTGLVRLLDLTLDMWSKAEVRRDGVERTNTLQGTCPRPEPCMTEAGAMMHSRMDNTSHSAKSSSCDSCEGAHACSNGELTAAAGESSAVRPTLINIAEKKENIAV